MKSLLLAVDQQFRIIHFHQLLKFNILGEDVTGRKLNDIIEEHNEFRDIMAAIEKVESSGGETAVLEPYFNNFYFGLVKGFYQKDFLSEKVRVMVSRNTVNGENFYLVFAEYSEKVQEYILLAQEKEKISIESVNVLREISRTVLNESSSKVAAKKSLELVSSLFGANTAVFRLYTKDRAELYASFGLPYGYVGRNAQIQYDMIPVYKEVLVGQRTVVSEDPEKSLGRLYPELAEIVKVGMAAVVPIVRKDQVIATLTLTFERPYQIIKECTDILDNVVNELDFLIERNEYYYEILTTTERLTKLTMDIVTSLSDAIETRDSYTNGHSNRVAIYSVEIARNMGWDDYELDRLRIAGILHDIGKVGIPDAVLLKPTPLNKYEFEIMKLHPEISANIVSKIESFQDLVPWIRFHHEFYDGSGYPYGLKGNEIPVASRIIAVADAYDAMSSDRPYRKALPIKNVIDIFREGAGGQWDKDIVEVAIKNLEVVSRKNQWSYNIPEKLDEFRKMIFNISLLSGLYLYEFIYDEVEKYVDQQKQFTIAMVSLKEVIADMNPATKKRLMNTLIEIAKAELHYPVMVGRYNYYQLIVFAPLMNKKFLKSLLTRLQIKLFEKADIFFSTNLINYPDDGSNTNEIFEKLIYQKGEPLKVGL